MKAPTKPAPTAAEQQADAGRTGWLSGRTGETLSWAALIVAATIFFWLARGTSYQQLAIGVLAASLSLVILTVLLELIWGAVAPLVDGAERRK